MVEKSPNEFSVFRRELKSPISGTEKVAELRRTYPPDRVLPALYGCHGLVDIQTVDQILTRP